VGEKQADVYGILLSIGGRIFKSVALRISGEPTGAGKLSPSHGFLSNFPLVSIASGFGAKVFEIGLMKPHPVEFPAKQAAQAPV